MRSIAERIENVWPHFITKLLAFERFTFKSESFTVLHRRTSLVTRCTVNFVVHYSRMYHPMVCVCEIKKLGARFRDNQRDTNCLPVKTISFRKNIITRHICFRPTVSKRDGSNDADFHRSGNYDSTEFFILLDFSAPTLALVSWFHTVDKFYVTTTVFLSRYLKSLLLKRIKSRQCSSCRNK